MAATTMKARLEKFKINMPLINALCNPGIKERHWQMMNEKVTKKVFFYLKKIFCYESINLFQVILIIIPPPKKKPLKTLKKQTKQKQTN